jgi:hypothetical protein
MLTPGATIHDTEEDARSTAKNGGAYDSYHSTIRIEY